MNTTRADLIQSCIQALAAIQGASDDVTGDDVALLREADDALWSIASEVE